MLAFPTCHVVAATVLFDCRVAFRAFFCVGGNPVSRLGVVFALFDPLLNQAARRWLMIIQRTAETEAMVANTIDGRHDTSQVSLFDRALNGILTIWCWAPFQVLPIINIGTSEQDVVAAGIKLACLML